MALTISSFADSFGLKSDTLRYYERRGLLHPPQRSAAGYRLYDKEAAERLEFIRGAQRMGLRLDDIKDLLDVRDRGKCPCGHTQVLVERRVSEVDAEIKQLRAIRKALLDLKDRNEACLDAPAGEWTCLTGIGKGGGR